MKKTSKTRLKLMTSLYKNGFTFDQICKKLKTSDITINKALTSFNIIKRKRGFHCRKYSYNKKFFEKIDNEEKAYWLGFIYADGCITGNSLKISLQEKDRNHVIKFKKAIGSNNRLYFRQERKLKNGGFNQKQYAIAINDKELCQQMIKLGCFYRKSLIIKFPSYKIVPEYLIHHFMRGYFDGDGCICKVKWNYKKTRKIYYAYRFSVVSSKFFIKKYLRILNKFTGLKIVKFNPAGKAQWFSYAGKYNLTKIYNFLYKDATIYLNRKKMIWDTMDKVYIKKFSRKEQDQLFVLLIKLFNGQLNNNNLQKITKIHKRTVKNITQKLIDKNLIYKIPNRNNGRFFINE